MVVTTVRALDRLIAAYNALLAGLWVVHVDQAAYAAWIAAAHAAAAAIPWLLARAPRRQAGPMAVLRDLYPLLFLAPYWTELDLLRDVLPPGSFDSLVATLDRLVFGLHLHVTWMPAMPQVGLSELMFFMYFAYYPLIFLPPLVMALQGRRAAVRDIAFRLMVTYIGCYLIYICFPVYGPQYLMETYAGPHTEGFFYQIVEAAHQAGDSRGTAFPSSHVAGAVTIAYVGWRWFSRPVAVLLTIEAVGVILSTVYTQNHYGIDSLAGLLWGLAMQIATVPVIRHLLRGARRRRPIPILPDFTPILPATNTTGGGP